jgi:glycosyltransferase involved in cell wall biosynthesis
MSTVDILIPAYNAGRYLPAALSSVEAQTFPDWRILLVDDGSTDNTPDLVAPFRDRLGPKLFYIQQPNAGLPAARNTAIRHATADYLALLDADDIWLPDRLAASVHALNSHPDAGLAYGLIHIIDTEGAILRTWPGNPAHAEGDIAPHIYMRSVELPCPTITFRRICIDQVGFFDETMRATEDRDLWLRIALRYQVAFIPEVIALYRTSPGSMSDDPERMLEAQLSFIDKHFGSPGCGPRQRRAAVARAYKQHAETLAQRGRPKDALRSAFRAVAVSPLDQETLRTAASLLRRSAGRRPPVKTC